MGRVREDSQETVGGCVFPYDKHTLDQSEDENLTTRWWQHAVDMFKGAQILWNRSSFPWHGGDLSCCPQSDTCHFSIAKALWAQEALVKGRTRLWETKSGWKGYQTEITCQPSQDARAGNSGWESARWSHNTNKPVTRTVKISIIIY